MSDTRKQFEDAVFNDYFVRGIKFVENKQFAEVRNQKTQAELCERDGEYYKDENISRMWHGWKLAAAHAEKVRAALTELVMLKDLKSQIECHDPHTGSYEGQMKRRDDYARRKPLAWEAARRLLK